MQNLNKLHCSKNADISIFFRLRAFLRHFREKVGNFGRKYLKNDNFHENALLRVKNMSQFKIKYAQTATSDCRSERLRLQRLSLLPGHFS